MKNDVLIIDNTNEINKEKIIESISYWINKIKSCETISTSSE
jgi:hypothetical protein